MKRIIVIEIASIQINYNRNKIQNILSDSSLEAFIPSGKIKGRIRARQSPLLHNWKTNRAVMLLWIPINYYKLYWNIEEVQWITNEFIILIIARVSALTTWSLWNGVCILFTSLFICDFCLNLKEHLDFIYAIAWNYQHFYFLSLFLINAILTSQVISFWHLSTIM